MIAFVISFGIVISATTGIPLPGGFLVALLIWLAAEPLHRKTRRI